MSRTTNNAGPHRAVPAGPILDNGIYPIGQIMAGMGWGPRKLADAKESGLRILTAGKYSYIYGGDLLEWLRQQPTIARHGGPGRPDLARHAADDDDEDVGAALAAGVVGPDGEGPTA